MSHSSSLYSLTGGSSIPPPTVGLAALQSQCSLRPRIGAVVGRRTRATLQPPSHPIVLVASLPDQLLSYLHDPPTGPSNTSPPPSLLINLISQRTPKSVPFGDKKCLGASRDPSEFQDNFKRDPRRLACAFPRPLVEMHICMRGCPAKWRYRPRGDVLFGPVWAEGGGQRVYTMNIEHILHPPFTWTTARSMRRPSRNAARCLPALNNEADFPFAQADALAALPASDGKSDETANRRIKCGQTGVQASHPHRLVQSTQYLLSIASPLITFIFCGRPRYDTNHERPKYSSACTPTRTRGRVWEAHLGKLALDSARIQQLLPLAVRRADVTHAAAYSVLTSDGQHRSQEFVLSNNGVYARRTRENADKRRTFIHGVRR
ncbi:hypothetical protein FB451DRAFT_1369368 [Mycena latifolia]|nr:hypothetical protein FB451DRAFT_1369368 [Mycena latifolia]